MNKKNILKFINKHLNLFIIIPPVLGGIWQIIELSKISFSFIRFFSVSQMIPDGLLILVILSIMFLSLYWTYSIFHEFKKEGKNDEKKLNTTNVINKKNWKAIMFFSIHIGLIFILAYVSIFFIDNIEKTYSIFFFLPANIFLSLFILISWDHAFKNLIVESEKDKLEYLLFLYLLTELMCILSFLSAFHTAFMLPKELKNIENLKCKIESVEPKLKMEILYANDKYIFVGHPEQSKENKKIVITNIRIFNFEDLLDETSCIEKKSKVLFIEDSITKSKKN